MHHRHAIRLWIILLMLAVVACSPVSKSSLTKRIKSIESSLHDHTGFMLYDLDKKKELFSFQGDQYFTPASNTKIVTFFTSLTILGDSVPSIQYIEKGDSLIFRGMGDPSFLYRETFDARRSFDFLANQSRKLFLAQQNFYTDALGPGWAWDDAFYTYSVERSALPVYGNFFTLDQIDNTLKIKPHNFSYNLQIKDSTKVTSAVRQTGSNKIEFYPGPPTKGNEQWDIPFKTGNELTAQLLTDTLKKPVTILNEGFDFMNAKIVKNTPLDSLYKVMMQESDNYVAEQLLMACSAVLSDTINPLIAIRYMQKNYFNDLPQPFVWKDGSGLSRYNLFTPASIIKLWERIYQKVPRERLFPLLAIGGKTGTIKNYYKSDPLSKLPYIYGKTGTLSNNHSLSGYLVTKKGRTFIFSFMSNNFVVPTRDVRVEMEKILKDIYLHY